jgi:hypothetical protein
MNSTFLEAACCWETVYRARVVRAWRNWPYVCFMAVDVWINWAELVFSRIRWMMLTKGKRSTERNKERWRETRTKKRRKEMRKYVNYVSFSSYRDWNVGKSWLRIQDNSVIIYYNCLPPISPTFVQRIFANPITFLHCSYRRDKRWSLHKTGNINQLRWEPISMFYLQNSTFFLSSSLFYVRYLTTTDSHLKEHNTRLLCTGSLFYLTINACDFLPLLWHACWPTIGWANVMWW